MICGACGLRVLILQAVVTHFAVGQEGLWCVAVQGVDIFCSAVPRAELGPQECVTDGGQEEGEGALVATIPTIWLPDTLHRHGALPPVLNVSVSLRTGFAGAGEVSAFRLPTHSIRVNAPANAAC